MAAPRYDIIQKSYQNPHAEKPLLIPILVVCNTSDEILSENVKINAARDLPWLQVKPAHNRKAIMVGGGPSAADCIDQIRALQEAGGAVFAMNGASKWLRSHGITPDYQVVSDAKEETASLVDPWALNHLFASQVNPKTMVLAPNPIVWHLETGDIEKDFPSEKVKRGGYALTGGGAATGNCAMCVAYVMGFRDFDVFGFDSSHRNGEGHAYPQPMNYFIPTAEITWAGRTFTCSVAMKAQAEKFQITAQALKQYGCKIEVHGDGLLQHMYNTPPANLTERDKYKLMWQFDGYREIAPGEFNVPIITQFMDKPGPIIDFGCGTGRASIRLREEGYGVMLVDFADNCRDDEALCLPFLEWDLTRPCPLSAPYGICSDMMEHIPTDDVKTVIKNIMGSAQTVFFQISTVPDTKGALIGQPLHMTVKPHSWWRLVFADLGYFVKWQENGDIASCFLVQRSKLNA